MSEEEKEPEGPICVNCGKEAKRIGNCAVYCPFCGITSRYGCGE